MGIFDKDIGNVPFVPQTGVDRSTETLVKAGASVANNIEQLGVKAIKGDLTAKLKRKFEQIRTSREAGDISSTRAQAEATNAVAQAASIAPGFATDFRKEFSNYFGEAGVGFSTFDKSANERAQDRYLTNLQNKMQEVNPEWNINNPEDVASAHEYFKNQQLLNFREQQANLQDLSDKQREAQGNVYLNDAASMGVQEFGFTIDDVISLSNTNERLNLLTRKKEEVINDVLLKYPGMKAENVKKQIDARFSFIEKNIGDNSILKRLKEQNELWDANSKQAWQGIAPFFMSLNNATGGTEFATTFLEALKNPATISEGPLRDLILGTTFGEGTQGEVGFILDNPDFVRQKLYDSFSRIGSGAPLSQSPNPQLDKAVASDILSSSANIAREELDYTPVPAVINAMDVVGNTTPEKIPDILVKNQEQRFKEYAKNRLVYSTTQLRGYFESPRYKGLELQYNKERGNFDLVISPYVDNDRRRYLQTNVIDTLSVDPFVASFQQDTPMYLVRSINALLAKGTKNGVDFGIDFNAYTDTINIDLSGGEPPVTIIELDENGQLINQ